MRVTIKSEGLDHHYELCDLVGILQKYHPEQYNKAIGEILTVLVGEDKLKDMLSTILSKIDPDIVIE